ncbi:MAG TPA: pitrilysin family protein [Gemmatimonadaceae bacterium]|nr:pitrilysin family protein [Gemmatimonadaceae bacterium]
MRFLHTGRVVAATVVLAVPALAQRAQSTSRDAIKIPFEQYKLANGLDVVLAPDHTSPTVAVTVYYHVGSKNEVAGRTGFAHMFEHVMFTGSGHVPYGMHDRLTEGVGGGNNGFTTNDETVYYETIPSNYLEDALWLESDRMGFLLDKLDSAKFNAQRDIVQNERRQRYDNQPYGRAPEIITTAVYPSDNPYSWPTVGYMSELKQATVEDVKQFFRTYYVPGNATLAIAGDFDPAQTKRWVSRYFADLPAGKPVVRPSVKPATVTKEKRLVFEDRVQVPRLYLAWPTVGTKSQDTYALNALSSILSDSRTARLTKALVYDRQSAASVNAVQQDRENVGEFVIILTPRPGHTLAELEAATDSVLERLKHEGPTAEEMQRASAGIEFGFVSNLESDLSKAITLAQGAAYFGDPGHYRIDYNRLKSVTTADVKRVANTYLGAGRVVLSIVPNGQTQLAAKPESSSRVIPSPEGGHYTMESR